jgi:DNA-binding PadR family transcriptional regulator
MRQFNQLPQVAFSILLTLGLGERHGYAIIKQVAEDSAGKIQLGPGALYTSLKQLVTQGLIWEVYKPEDVRRRYYRLSPKGTEALRKELEYYDRTILLARDRHVLA